MADNAKPKAGSSKKYTIILILLVVLLGGAVFLQMRKIKDLEGKLAAKPSGSTKIEDKTHDNAESTGLGKELPGGSGGAGVK